MSGPAQIAAKWWREALAGPQEAQVDRTGLPEQAPELASILTRVLRHRKPVEPKVPDAFERAVENWVEERLAWGSRIMQLHVDYEPWWGMADIVKKAGVPSGLLPWKTVMVITPTQITLRQNGAETVLWDASAAPNAP